MYNYFELLTAVYRRAVKDDWREAQRVTVARLLTMGVHKRIAQDFVKSKSEYIKKRVMENVAKEALEWGSRETVQMQLKGIRCAAETVIGGYDERYMYVKKSDKALKKSV